MELSCQDDEAELEQFPPILSRSLPLGTQVQYPEVRRMFALDIASVRLLATIRFPERQQLVAEMERQLSYEF